MFLTRFIHKARMPLLFPAFFSTQDQKPPENQGPSPSNPEISKLVSSLAKELEAKSPFLMNTNYNFEQNKEYTKKVKAALENTVKRQRVALRTQGQAPRRKRREYDRPKHDWDITSYNAWRAYDQLFMKPDDNVLKVVCKIPIAPALMLKVPIKY